MNDVDLKYLEKFNEYQVFFGEIDVKLMQDNSDDHRKLFYLFPMIERMIRFILMESPDSDIENLEKNIPRTLNPIIEKNYEYLEKIIGVDEINYIKELFSDADALRNRFMHYIDQIKFDLRDIMKTQKLFLSLVRTYVDNCM